MSCSHSPVAMAWSMAGYVHPGAIQLQEMIVVPERAGTRPKNKNKLLSVADPTNDDNDIWKGSETAHDIVELFGQAYHALGAPLEEMDP